MRIVVSDTSCIIDLHKVDLLFAILKLPYTFVIPHTLFDGDGVTRAKVSDHAHWVQANISSFFQNIPMVGTI